MKRMRTVGAILLTALAGACGPEPGEGPAAGGPEPIVRDSAGVRIVENGEAPANGWHTGMEPLFTVGWNPDGPMFTWLQSGRILPDGGALVGEFAEGAIYRLDTDGSVVGTWGRKGDGPGEYQALDAILLHGDSILVSDTRLRRVTLLSTEGEVGRTRRAPGTFLHRASAILNDGRLLLVPGEGYGAVGEIRPEWVFETQPILAAHAEGGEADTLAELPHLRRWYGTRGASPGPVHVKGRAGGHVDGFAWARSDQREIRWYDSTGRLVQVARWDEDPVPLTAEWRRRMVQRVEAGLRSSGANESFVSAQLVELEQGFDRHEGPLPYWDSLHVDRLGNVWVGEYTRLGEPSDSWRVFTRDGTFVGWVELPGIIAVLDITDDRILAVRLDESDVPAVLMIELIKA